MTRLYLPGDRQLGHWGVACIAVETPAAGCRELQQYPHQGKKTPAYADGLGQQETCRLRKPCLRKERNQLERYENGDSLLTEREREGDWEGVSLDGV